MNTCPEELVIIIFKEAERSGLLIDSWPHPVNRLERWPVVEWIEGVAKGTCPQLLGAVVFVVEFRDIYTQKKKERLVRFKVVENSKSSYCGFVIGGAA